MTAEERRRLRAAPPPAEASAEVEELRRQVEQMGERLLLARQDRAEAEERAQAAEERAQAAEKKLTHLLPARERLAEIRPALLAALAGYKDAWRFLPPAGRRRELTPLHVSAFHNVVAASSPEFHDGAALLTVDDLLSLAAE